MPRIFSSRLLYWERVGCEALEQTVRTARSRYGTLSPKILAALDGAVNGTRLGRYYKSYRKPKKVFLELLLRELKIVLFFPYGKEDFLEFGRMIDKEH